MAMLNQVRKMLTHFIEMSEMHLTMAALLTSQRIEESVADWTRKNLEVVVDALKQYRLECQARDPKGQMLAELELQANAALRSVAPRVKDLVNVKRILCEKCRKNQLYECDSDVRWTSMCAFLKANDPENSFRAPMSSSAHEPVLHSLESQSRGCE